MPYRIALGLLAVFLAAPASAQTVDCSTAPNQMAMTKCAGKDFKRADDALNTTYQLLLKKFAGPANARQLDRLRSAQRAWVGFRDAECALIVGSYEGGSIQPMLQAMCLAEQTDARTKTLQHYATCSPQQDANCP